jgi:dihydroxyacetone kinase
VRKLPPPEEAEADAEAETEAETDEAEAEEEEEEEEEEDTMVDFWCFCCATFEEARRDLVVAVAEFDELLLV